MEAKHRIVIRRSPKEIQAKKDRLWAGVYAAKSNEQTPVAKNG